MGGFINTTFYSTTLDTGQLDVDNVTIDGNTISATNTNGNLILKANGTGDTKITTPGDSDAIVVDDAGVTSKPLESAFLAYSNTNQANATGNSTSYVTVQCNTETYDQNSDYNNGTYTFTAPVDGVYILTATVYWGGNTGASTQQITRFNTSNETVVADQSAPLSDFLGNCMNSSCITTWMDAADTATLEFRVIGEATDVITIYGQSTSTRFSATKVA